MQWSAARHGPFTPEHIPDLLTDTLESYLYCKARQLSESAHYNLQFKYLYFDFITFSFMFFTTKFQIQFDKMLWHKISKYRLKNDLKGFDLTTIIC